MRHASALLLLVVALIGLLATTRPGPVALAQDGTPAADEQGIVGSWAITITGQVEGEEPFTFVNFATIMPGGVLVNTPPGGPLGHGAWEHIGDEEYALTILLPEFDDEGNLTGQTTIRSTIALGQDGDTFTGPYVNEFTDPTGAVLFAVGGTAEAERIVVEPMGTPAAGMVEAATPAP
jgi:hypothetical protein